MSAEDDSNDRQGRFAAFGVVPTSARPKQPSRVKKRLIEAGAALIEDENPDLCFQHSVFCQAGLPYRNPGDAVREWRRTQGATMLVVQAGQVLLPAQGTVVDLGLPWGPKPRLILAHLNAEALRQGSPEIAVEHSLSAFVRRIRGFDHGREIRAFKDQLSRLANATVRLAISKGAHVEQINTQIVGAFDLWLTKDERQRVLWPSTIRLSREYFESLQAHAVPLPEQSLAALAHSAVALDLFAWLAQRLHRIDMSRPVFIPWARVKDQFGPGYGRMVDFRAFFRRVLNEVSTQYPAARLDIDQQGVTLYHSPPPVPPKLFKLPGVRRKKLPGNA